MRHWRGRVAGFVAGLLLGGWLLPVPAFAQGYMWGSVNGIPYGPGVTLSGPVVQTSGGYNGVSFAKIAQVCAMGDSLSDDTWESSLTTTLGAASWRVVSKGVGGHTTTQMAARLTADCLTASQSTEYLVVLGGINDVMNDIVAATIETNLAAMYAAAKAAGAQVVAVTMTPYKTHASWSAGRQVVLDAVNAWILAKPANVDYVIDAYTALEDPAAADTLLAAYSSDWLHLSTAGYAALAQTIYAQTMWAKNTTTLATLGVEGTAEVNQDTRTFATPTFAGVRIAMATPARIASAVASQEAGSDLAAGVYQLRLVVRDHAGGVTLPSGVLAKTVEAGGLGKIVITYTVPAGAQDVRVYVSTANGAEADRYFTSTSLTTYSITTLTGATVAALPTTATAYVASLTAAQAWDGSNGLLATRFGYDANYLNVGSHATGFGYLANYSNLGASVTGVGASANLYNAGSGVTGVGFSANSQNTAANVSGLGFYVNYQNAGANSSGLGYTANYQNVGLNALGLGWYAGRSNNWPNYIRVGSNTAVANYFPADGATDYAVTEASLSANTITGTHGFPGANGSKINLLWTLTSGSAPTGLVTGTVYQFTRTSATVLTLAGIASTGVCVGKLTNSYDQTGSIVIGNDAMASKANQVVLGPTTIVETLLRGDVTAGTTGGTGTGAFYAGSFFVGTTAGADCTSAGAVTVAKGIVTACSQPAATSEQLLALIASLQQRIAALEAAGSRHPQ